MLGLAGCGPTIVLEGEDSSTGDDGMGSATRTTGATQTTGTSTGTTTGTPPSGDVTTDGRETLDTAADGMFPDFGLPEGCADQAPLGAPCADPSDCCSGQCFTVGPLGGVCSECDGDEDCEFGCNFGSPLSGMPAVCGDGLPGAGCQTSDACQLGLSCVPIIEVPGIIETSSCSECSSDVDCPGQQCAPLYFEDLFTGTWICAANETVPNGQGCGGDEECLSGSCALATLMGIPVLTVCSECTEDADCPGSCVLPEVEISGTGLELVPGFCA